MDGTRLVLLLGNGGREAAWAQAIHDAGADIINWAPTINPGIEQIAKDVIQAGYDKLPSLNDYQISLAIIGPELPLVLGVTDQLEAIGIKVFGPTETNARLEGSKTYMRSLMSKYSIEGNIEYYICENEDDLIDALDKNHIVAVKPDGLTGGKGVKVYGDHLKDRGEVEDYARDLINKDGKVLIEELLEGSEFTLQAFVWGSQFIFLPLVKDYKRAFDEDIGPNTGSMGSVSLPSHKLPSISDEDLEKAKSIVQHVVNSASIENGTYHGPIYGQFMLTEMGPKIVEFNVRLGDPEAINTLALFDHSLIDLIDQLMDEDEIPYVSFKNVATCCVYIVPEGYPDEPEPGAILDLDIDSEMIRYASVIRTEDGIMATKSRSVAIIGTGETLEEARDNAYGIIPSEIKGFRYRTDIGLDILEDI